MERWCFHAGGALWAFVCLVKPIVFLLGRNIYGKSIPKQDILRLVEEQNVKFIRLQFTDILACSKMSPLPTNNCKKRSTTECMFDGSSIEGFVRIEERLCSVPDLDSFEIFPWIAQENRVARPDLQRTPPRRHPCSSAIRARAHPRAGRSGAHGLHLQRGAELEFFLFHPMTKAHHQDAGRCRVLRPGGR